MYFNLALKNIKRSLKDYTIYFLTLIFGVCIFYTFNSINSQGIMMNLSETQKILFQNINMIMGVASVFVSFILGFLILYANNYLIKRRKKEFGIYMTLGMERGNLAKILFFETLIIGFLSLTIGLIIGIILSQGLALFTAKLFQVQMVEFKFIFSSSAALKTVGCFAIIYFIILIFNNISVRKIKLINLINAKKKSEKILIKNIWISVIIFFISVVMIGTAYYLMLRYGIATLTAFIFVPVSLGAIGTFLLFFSLSGFLLKLTQGNKKYYLSGLNMFIARQLNSKINTTFISMTFISLMLFIAICTLSGGLGINTALNTDVKDLSQYDISVWDNDGGNINQVLANNNLNISDYTSDYSEINYYKTDIHFDKILTPSEESSLKNYYPILTNQSINVIKLSALNKTLEMLGRKPIKLDSNKYAVVSDINDMTTPINNFLKRNVGLSINNQTLTAGTNSAINVVLYNNTMKFNLATLVVNDSVLTGLEPLQSYLNINAGDKSPELAKTISKISNAELENNIYIISMTKEEVVENSSGISAIVSYLAIYLGLIFTIAAAALLAIQQLTDSTDNIERYRLLTKIGVDNSMINKSLLIQISLYFALPLIVAIIHSIVGLDIASTVAKVFGSTNTVKNIVISFISLFTIYGAYFMATYVGAKNNIKRNL